MLLPNSIEVSVHNCPKLVQSELGLILPAHKGALAGAKIIATAQRAALDLVSTGPDVEAEKDALLEKVRGFRGLRGTCGSPVCCCVKLCVCPSACSLCRGPLPCVKPSLLTIIGRITSTPARACRCARTHVSSARTHDGWSGVPTSPSPQGLSCRGSTTFSEVDSFEHLLGYKTSNAGCCKVLHHPVWGSGVYPASVVTNAPLDMIVAALGLGECGAPAAASPNEGLPALASDA